MVRSKVNLTYIQNASARRASFGKRAEGIKKKVGKLSTLCDIQTCSIIYGPYKPKPDVCPSEEEARGMIERYRNMSAIQQLAKKDNQESFTNARIKKQEERLKKIQKQNYRNDMTRVMLKRLRGEATSKAREEDLLEMGSVAEEQMKEITEWMEKIRLENPQASHGTGEGGNAEQGGELSVVREEARSGQNIDLPSNMPMDPELGNVGQLNKLLSYDHRAFNWDDNATLFPSIYDN